MTRMPSVAVVTVTYGERAELLRQVVESLNELCEDELIAKLVVVDNGSSLKTKRYLKELQEVDPRLQVVEFATNAGSAAGFKAGIETACAAGCEYIWLLDDDNRPEKQALAQVFFHLRRLEAEHHGRRIAVVSMRMDRIHMKRIAAGADPKDEFPDPRSYLGFTSQAFVIGLVKRLLSTVKPKGVLDSAHTDAIEQDTPTDLTDLRPAIAIPYSPYGGMFFRAAVVDEIGLPDERFFCYADDSEYSYRITRAGGRLYLISSSRITDIDRSWHIRSPGSMLTKPLREKSDFRVYYSVRNRLYFDTRTVDHRGLQYQFNRLIFIGLTHVLAATSGNWRRLALLRSAIRDGERGKLGMRHELEP